MPTHFRVIHEMQGALDAFWKIFFDETYKTELYQRLSAKRTVLAKREDEKTIFFSERIEPQRDLPGFLKKLVGNALGYVEISTYIKGENKVDVRIEPSLLKERFKMRGLYTVAQTEPGKLRRLFEGDIAVDIALVGGKIERTVIDDVDRSYGIAAEVTQQWLNRLDAK